jgi:hypothetical protein
LEVAMSQRAGLIASLREVIAREKLTIERLKSEKFWVFGYLNGARVNRKQEEIEDAQARIASNEVVLKACEKDDAQGS